MSIGEKIEILCNESRIKQNKLADSIGVTEATISRYINKERTPNINILIMISEYFGVSTDWLLGLSERRNYNGMIDGDELLGYCEKASVIAEELRKKCFKYDSENAHKIADCVRAEAYFEHEYCTWKFTIPNMIHSVADGSWKAEGKKE